MRPRVRTGMMLLWLHSLAKENSAEIQKMKILPLDGAAGGGERKEEVQSHIAMHVDGGEPLKSICNQSPTDPFLQEI